MSKLFKTSLIFSSAILFSVASHAGPTVVQVQGDAPKSASCDALHVTGQTFGIVLIMRGTQYKSPIIKSTQGFSFQKTVPFNNEGVKGSCDYYLNPTAITINGEAQTLQRLLINSVYDANKRACTNVQVTFSIAAPNSNSCDIQMSE